MLRPLTLTGRARLPEQNADLVDVEVLPDRLAFVYRAPTKSSFAIDDVVAGVLHEGYLRRLTSVVQASPTRIETMTVNAELGELIGDGHFRVKFAPGDGVGEWAPSGEIGVSKSALTTGWSAFTPKFRNIACGATTGGSLSLTPRLDVDLGMDLDIDIAWSTRFLIPRGEVVGARVELHGALEAGLTAVATNNLSASCSYDLIELAKTFGAPVPERAWTMTFAVGPVPVIVKHKIRPYATISAGAEVEVGRATASAMGRVGIRAGTQYDPAAGWRPIWEPTVSGDVALTTERTGKLTAKTALSGGVGYSIKIYDAVGPGLAFGPRVAGSFAASPDCSWSADVKAGLTLTGSIDVTVPVFDYKLASFSVSSVLVERTLADAGGRFPGCEDAEPALEAGPDTAVVDTAVEDTFVVDTAVVDTAVEDTFIADTASSDAAKKPNGSPCAAAGECLSGFCPPQDGVCCNERCDTVCRSCKASKNRAADGACTAIKEDTDPDNECPSLQTCQAGSTSVGATAYCKAHFGDPCTDTAYSTDCPGAGFCRDGVCCNQASCTLSYAPCTACKASHTGGVDGYCAQVIAGTDPFERCSGAAVCNGDGGCM